MTNISLVMTDGSMLVIEGVASWHQDDNGIQVYLDNGDYTFLKDSSYTWFTVFEDEYNEDDEYFPDEGELN